MRKVVVITQKELVESEKLKNSTAVVIDVFLATSSIVYALENDCRYVAAVPNYQAGLKYARSCLDPFLLLGETKGSQIEGVAYPDPTTFGDEVHDKAVILSSTNGTIAINKASQAKYLFISSLLNGHAIAQRIISQNDNSSIILICSGNDNRFSIEDFVGAGQVIHYLKLFSEELSLSDSASAALHSYQAVSKDGFKSLYNCETAKLLNDTGFGHTIPFVIDNIGKMNTVPLLNGDIIIKDNIPNTLTT